MQGALGGEEPKVGVSWKRREKEVTDSYETYSDFLLLCSVWKTHHILGSNLISSPNFGFSQTGLCTPTSFAHPPSPSSEMLFFTVVPGRKQSTLILLNYRRMF